MVKTIKYWFEYISINKSLRTLLLITLSMFLIITIAGFSVYNGSKTILQSEINEPQIHLLRIGMESVNASIMAADQIAVNVMLSNYTFQFLHSDKLMTQIDMLKYIDYLDYLAISPQVESVQVYDIVQQRIIGSSPLGYSARLSNISDLGWQSYVQDLQSNQFQIVDRSQETSKPAMITIFRAVTYNNEIVGVVIVNLDKKKLFDTIFQNYTSQTDAARFVLDEKGSIIHEANNKTLSQQQVTVMTQSNTPSIDYSDGDDHYLVAQIVPSYRMEDTLPSLRNKIYCRKLITYEILSL